MRYNLEPCRICGRKPKLTMSKSGYSAVVCKPLFQKTHWICETFTAEKAVEAWNKRNGGKQDEECIHQASDQT